MVIAAEREGIHTVNTELITACVVSVLAVILGVRQVIRGLRMLTEESRRFLVVMVSFSREGRVLRRELRKWRGRKRQTKRNRRKEVAEPTRPDNAALQQSAQTDEMDR